MILDLRELTFIGSSGLTAIIGLHTYQHRATLTVLPARTPFSAYSSTPA